MKTYAVRKRDVSRAWHLIDAAERPLGRVATEVAILLRGKHKPTFSPSLDTGDYVIVINAAKVAVTGNKLEKKMYYRHSGYPGGLRQAPLKDVLARRPEWVMEKAVRGMLPKTRLGRQQLAHLRVYAAADHPHAGQIAQAAKATGAGA
ncbi:MAG: 50S ribosomal protein L13 [Dehalococcoidia bacterium]